jgi:hypothetical protein
VENSSIVIGLSPQRISLSTSGIFLLAEVSFNRFSVKGMMLKLYSFNILNLFITAVLLGSC